MTPTELSSADFIWVRVVASGDDCNIYACDRNARAVRLAGVHRTDTLRPADLAAVPDSASEDETELPVLLFRHRAIFPGCLVSARPLGLLTLHSVAENRAIVVAVPAADEGWADWREYGDLSDDQRAVAVGLARTFLEGPPDDTAVWADAARARELVHQRKQAARLAQARTGKSGPTAPAWKPLGYRALGARRSSELEPHSEAEYAYLQLPARFREYIDSYLTDEERILFAVRRPAMRSDVQRSFLRKSLLQEGMLLLTDQQAVLACEIMPPDLTGIRYGYAIQGGVPERIAAAAVRTAADHAYLDVTWQAELACQTTTWEFPVAAEAELVQAADLLRAWQPVPGDTRLRRAFGPSAREIRWHDPAEAAPGAAQPLAERLTGALHAELDGAEPVLATALLPAWAASDKKARGLVVTDRRVLWLADPASNNGSGPVSYPLNQIASLEFQSSIVESWLALHLLERTGPRRVVIPFPYTVQDFRDCYIALRQQMVAIAAADSGPQGRAG